MNLKKKNERIIFEEMKIELKKKLDFKKISTLLIRTKMNYVIIISSIYLLYFQFSSLKEKNNFSHFPFGYFCGKFFRASTFHKIFMILFSRKGQVKEKVRERGEGDEEG